MVDTSQIDNQAETLEPEVNQTVFEGHQTMLQPPPARAPFDPKRKRSLMIIVGSFTAFVVLMLAVIVLSGPSDTAQVPKATPIPTPMPIYTDPAKEAELQRVEAIIRDVNPETLLIPPPQVDMTVQF